MARNVVTRKGKAAVIEGLPELQKRISDVLTRTTGREIKKVWMRAALVLRDEARDLAPELQNPAKANQKVRAKAGILKQAIFAAYGDDAKQNVLVGVSYKKAPHAHWLEYGNSRIPAQPYMRPALAATRAKCVAIIAEGYRAIIAKAGA